MARTFCIEHKDWYLGEYCPRCHPEQAVTDAAARVDDAETVLATAEDETVPESSEGLTITARVLADSSQFAGTMETMARAQFEVAQGYARAAMILRAQERNEAGMDDPQGGGVPPAAS